MPNNDHMVVTYADYGDEKSTVSLPTWELSSVNYATYFTEQDALRDAIEGVTLGARVSIKAVIEDTFEYTAPANPAAQREAKWLVRYKDSNGKRYSTELPCADVTTAALWLDGQDRADLNAAAWQAFVSAFEDHVRQGVAHNLTCEVLEVIFVGRNT